MNREFSLKVYGQKAFDILQAAFQYSCNHIRKRGFLRETHLCMKSNSEVVIVANNWANIPKDPQANLAYVLKEFLHWKTSGKVSGSNFKNFLGLEFKLSGMKSSGMDYSNDREKYEIVTNVGEVRCLYEILLGREEKRIISTYGEKTFHEMKGEPADCFASTQKEIYIQEMKSLKQQREDELTQIREEYKRRYDELLTWERDMKDKLNTDFDKKETDLKMKFDEAIVREVDSSNMYYLQH